MKSFNESMALFEDNINKYLSKGFTRSSIKRAAKTFLEEIKTKTSVEDLLKFAMDCKNEALLDPIWKSIREIAGFTEVHIQYLIPFYAKRHQVYVKARFDDLGVSKYRNLSARCN